MTTKANNYDIFDAKEYVQSCFPGAPSSLEKTRSGFMMEWLARFYTAGTLSSVAPNSLRVLDYGCGPSIALSMGGFRGVSGVSGNPLGVSQVFPQLLFTAK